MIEISMEYICDDVLVCLVWKACCCTLLFIVRCVGCVCVCLRANAKLSLEKIQSAKCEAVVKFGIHQQPDVGACNLGQTRSENKQTNKKNRKQMKHLVCVYIFHSFLEATSFDAGEQNSALSYGVPANHVEYSVGRVVRFYSQYHRNLQNLLFNRT